MSAVDHAGQENAPFLSAWQNKAMDKLEGMVGTLRVNAALLVSPEAYWVFTGDDFDLKISDREHPSYLVFSNDPKKEQIVGSLNALILNRLVTRVNSKGNLPVSIIVDDHKVFASISEKMDYLVPAAKIADMATGWLAGQAARDFTPTDMTALDGINIEESEEFKTTKYFCKTNFDMDKIKQEESFYVDLPKIYTFASEKEKEIMLNRNFLRVNEEIQQMVDELLGTGGEG